MKYEDRPAKNPAAKKLFEIMAEKKTNLCVANDHFETEKFMKIARSVGDEIAMLKTHVDILDPFNSSITAELRELGDEHNFIVFEDRKFADIGNTVKLQFTEGIYKIADWADMTNAHVVPGPGILKALQEAMQGKKCQGVLILAQMSTEETLCTGEYTNKAVEMANQFECVAGYIGAGSNDSEIMRLKGMADPGHAICTPGVKFGGGGDSTGQKYATPESAIMAGSDCLIVGRGVYKADDPVEAAKKYREVAWKAYAAKQ